MNHHWGWEFVDSSYIISFEHWKKTWLFRVFLLGIILPRYLGIIINHYEDPWKPTSIMERNINLFFFVVHLNLLDRFCGLLLIELLYNSKKLWTYQLTRRFGLRGPMWSVFVQWSRYMIKKNNKRPRVALDRHEQKMKNYHKIPRSPFWSNNNNNNNNNGSSIVIILKPFSYTHDRYFLSQSFCFKELQVLIENQKSLMTPCHQ